MTEPPRRDDVIELLEKLGSDRDEDVLEAAREVHARITAAGMTWEDLLVSDGGAAAENDDTGADDTDDDDTDDADDTDADDTDADDTDDDDADDYDSDDDDDDDNDDDDDDDESADEDDDESADEDDDTDESDEGDEGEATRPAAKVGSKHADSIALIDELLAKSKISPDMREELKGYKTDIAEGEFAARDRRYLSAVHKRLSKRR